jgi:NAD-dependent deacetylase
MSTRLHRVLVVTGSGISAESGIPTFRGRDGYWRTLDPTSLATMNAFQHDPGLVWEWYRERRTLIRRSGPNAAHQAIVELARHADDLLLVTQNVDDLHARAAWNDQRLSAEAIVQIHGDIFVTRCIRCDFTRRDVTAADDPSGVPVCPRCGSHLRPGVVWFDEELEAADVRRVEAFLRAGPCDHVLVVGTTASFEYIVEWVKQGARGGQMIEINPDETPLSPFASEVVREPAAVSVPKLVARLIEPRAEHVVRAQR